MGSLTHRRSHTCEVGPYVRKGLWKKNLRGVVTNGNILAQRSKQHWGSLCGPDTILML